MQVDANKASNWPNNGETSGQFKELYLETLKLDSS